MKKRKAQFFVLGAILLVSLFFAGLPKSNFIAVERTEDIVYLFDNVEREFPIALNNALNTTNDIEPSVDYMFNFTRFIDRLMTERLVNYTTLWVIARNSSTTDVNLTVGSFLKYNTSVFLNLSGTTNNLTVDHNQTNSTTVSGVSSTYNLTIQFDEESAESVEFARDKVSMYVWVKMERDENIIRGILSV
ncbi:MAG: hypothetical protein ABIJ92_01755 [Candidatus Aenigmatarchaeota archaeon]